MGWVLVMFLGCAIYASIRAKTEEEKEHARGLWLIVLMGMVICLGFFFEDVLFNPMPGYW